MFWLLRGVMAIGLTVALMGCGALPTAFTNPLDQMIKDHGAGTYVGACTVAKDGKELGSVIGEWECTADMRQLTGCHPQGITVKGPK